MTLPETTTYADLGVLAPEPVCRVCGGEGCPRCDDLGFDYGVDDRPESD
ncbi:hypothetical protein [Brachybacterium hainanense]|uniref:Uncharacterized protein n=1 Tax=Brachybacterium hainanense TaxID=1541174 RepID=A0ABV6R954_9MICO